MRVEPKLSFPIEGSRFQVDCYADGSKDRKTPTVKFVDGDNLDIKANIKQYIVYSRNSSR